MFEEGLRKEPNEGDDGSSLRTRRRRGAWLVSKQLSRKEAPLIVRRRGFSKRSVWLVRRLEEFILFLMLAQPFGEKSTPG